MQKKAPILTRLKKIRKKLILSLVALFLVASVVFGLYLRSLYRQLEEAFVTMTESLPTRLYSDLTRVGPALPRKEFTSRLKALGYSFKDLGDQVEITLHQSDYPLLLLPENHQTQQLFEKPINIKFDGTGESALISSISNEGKDISEFYLEPELIATLVQTPEGKIQVKKEIRTLLSWKEIPTHLRMAVIAAEDNHFLEHRGFDIRGIARAVLVNFSQLSLSQGGSTITQQLVKNLTQRHGRNLFKKFNEFFLAVLLDSRFSKEDILERYLNEIALGQVGSAEVHGVMEGAYYFFDKKVQDLHLGEIALLVGLIRGPTYYSPHRHFDRAKERSRWVLKRMVDLSFITEKEAAAAAALPIRLSAPKTVVNKAPYFTDYAKAEVQRQLKGQVSEQEISARGFRIYTSLDILTHQAAQEAITAGIADLEKKYALKAQVNGGERLEAALAAVDHRTGLIRTLIGGRNYAESSFNRILNMKRQVGSTFKPFVFLTAYLAGKDANGVSYSAGYPLEDGPLTLTYDHGKQSWSPKNYEKDYLGTISFRTTLAKSINTATARLAIQLTPKAIVETARRIGLESELPEVPSLSLGVAELTPVELLKAYSVIANRGVGDDPSVIRAITEKDGTIFAHFEYHPKEKIPPMVADLTTELLQAVFTDGTASESLHLGFDRSAAGKTGTTSQYRDAWFAGFTPQLTTVVWVGTDQTQPPIDPVTKKPTKLAKLKLTGAGAALPIWVHFMKDALESEPPVAISINQELASTRIDSRTGKKAATGCPLSQTSIEHFRPELEPTDTSCERDFPAPKPTIEATQF